MPCKQQLSDLVLCIVSQGKTGNSFHISYKNNLLSCGYVQFSCGGETQTALQWDTDSAFGFCLPSPRSLARWCRSGHKEFRIRPWFTAQQKQEGTGIISLGKISTPHLLRVRTVQKPLQYSSLMIHLTHVWGFSVSNHPGSSSKPCTQIGHP